MRAKITLRLISTLTPGEQDAFVWDLETKGFGLKLTPAGSIIYLVQTRLGGRLKRYTIGRHGAPWTPDAARREALRLLGRIADGDPPDSKREEHRKALTVAELCDLYLAEGCHLKKPSTLATDRGRLERHIKPLLGRRRVRDVTRAHIERFMIEVADGKSAADIRTALRGRAIVKGGKGTASRTVGLLGAIFRFAVDRSLIEVNPVRGVRRFPDRKCERFLAAAEISALGAALSESEARATEGPFAIAAIRFLLLTGCRRGEALDLMGLGGFRTASDPFHGLQDWREGDPSWGAGSGSSQQTTDCRWQLPRFCQRPRQRPYGATARGLGADQNDSWP